MKHFEHQVVICQEEISAKAILEKIPANPHYGAVVSFEGVVRGQNEGKTVTGILYECFQPMAEKELKKIAEEAGKKYSVDRIFLAHRYGHLKVGEISLALVVCSPHRKEAFAGAQYIIDELKKRVPIWKKEYYETKTAVVLAGGESRRFGSDKTKAKLSGKSLLHIVIERLKNSGFEVVISGGPPEKFSSFGCSMIEDALPFEGPLQAMAGSFLKRNEKRILFVACDMPLLKEGIVNKLWNHDLGADIVLLESAGKKKMLPGIYSNRIVPIAKSLLSNGRRDIKALCDSSLIMKTVPKKEWRIFDPKALSLFNVNRKEDLIQAHSLHEYIVTHN